MPERKYIPEEKSIEDTIKESKILLARQGLDKIIEKVRIQINFLEVLNEELKDIKTLYL